MKKYIASYRIIHFTGHVRFGETPDPYLASSMFVAKNKAFSEVARVMEERDPDWMDDVRSIHIGVRVAELEAAQ